MASSEMEQRLLAALIRDWGYVVGSAGLRQALGYPTQAALRQGIAKGAVPVPVFCIAGRKGPYALAHDLAAWLASRGAPQPESKPTSRRRSTHPP
jgi:hypothetical protein